MNKNINIGNHIIGPGQPIYGIAEIGLNHGGDIDIACDMIAAAARAGAKAAKFQALKANSLVARTVPNAAHQNDTLSSGESVYEMFQRMEFSDNDLKLLVSTAQKAGITFLSSVFDLESLSQLEAVGCPAYKIASGDVTHIPLIEAVASCGKPVLLSVGMATLSEIALAVDTIRTTGNQDLILFQCTSSYPTNAEHANLRKIPALAQIFEVPVGFSDHSVSDSVPLAAAALGACSIERHFTTDQGLPGGDNAMSADPETLSRIFAGAEEARLALGSATIEPDPVEQEGRVLFRRSVTSACSIAKGTVIRPEMLVVKRPATGIPPAQLNYVIGRTAQRDIGQDEALTWEMV